MLENIFNALGLEPEEAKIYLLLLETGPITAGNLAKKIGMPRSSVYGFLKRLQNHNLILESQKQGVKTFSAETPEKINLLFRQRQETLTKNQELFKNLLPSLKPRVSQKFITPKVQLFEGKEGLQAALKDMLLFYDMETQALWPIKAMVDILSPDFFRYLNKERIKNNLYTRAIWPRKQTVNIAEHPYLGVGEAFKREIRLAPAAMDFSMGYWIYGNRVVFISSIKESFGFIIESAEMAETLKAQFEIIWGLSAKMSVDPEATQAFVKEIEKFL
jgi:DNA-binding transcriptional regulator GbsR (MarR family)